MSDGVAALDRSEMVLFGLMVLVGVGAPYAGGALFWRPDGSLLGYPRDWLRFSPFPDFRISGLILFAVVGVGTLLGAWGVLTRRSWGADTALGAGIVQMGWIASEVLLLRWAHRLHLIVFAFGLITAVLAWRVRSSWRRSLPLRRQWTT